LNASHKIKAYLDMTIENQINHLTFTYDLFNLIALSVITTQITTGFGNFLNKLSVLSISN